MFKTILILVMAALCLNFSARTQTITRLTGRITTAADNKPLPGASIKIKSINISTQTDQDGNFAINTMTNTGTLIISYTGYITEEISFNTSKSTIIHVALKEKQGDLEEVVVIGYGQTTKRLNTGSVSSITAKEIENQPVTNVLSALSGRMPGVFVQTTNGLPGGNINIQIRGKGSIAAGTDPLYIIDGVPYEGNAPNPAMDFQSTRNIAGAMSPLNNLNPADIESITVLKDADATSIYGSRGSNGVILITTKKAGSGDAKLEVNIQQGANKIAGRPGMLSLEEHLELRKAAFAGNNIIPSADPRSSAYAPDLTVWSQIKSTDWVDYIYGNTARSTDIQARISGGMANTTFSVNGNYRHENTILPGSNNFERGSLHAQFQHRSANNKFNISIINQLTHQFNNIANPINAIATSFRAAPNYPLYLPDGTLNWYSGTNIIAEINARSKTRTENTITNLSLSYLLLPALNFKINAGQTSVTYNQALIFPTRALRPGNINNSIFGNNSSQSFIIEPQLDYALKLKTSSISFLAGATLQNRTNERLYIEASDFKLESLMEDLGSAGAIGARQTTYSQYKYASVFGRVSYNLMDSYMVNATIRRDGSSRFGPGNRFGNFGSIGAAWIFSNSEFIKEYLPALSYGKLRVSYGITGNDQIGDYQYLSTYSSLGGNTYQNTATSRPARIANANFHWETTHKTDLGVELGLIKDRILITADYYINKSKDQLVYYSIPQLTGFDGYQANLPAVIQNKGWELGINTKILRQRNFNWSATLNITMPKNQLKSFENFETSGYKETYEIGYDISRIRGYKSLGIDPATGKPIYAGQDGTASASPYFNFTLGKLTPDYYGGVGNTFSYSNFSFNIFAQFVKQVAKGGLAAYPGSSVFNNYDLVKDRWSPSNPGSGIPKENIGVFDPYYTGSSINIFNTSYLRIKNVSLSYAIPAELLKRYKIKSLRIYAETQNLLTFWNRKAAVFDPESGVLTTAENSRNVPPMKTCVFGLQFTL